MKQPGQALEGKRETFEVCWWIRPPRMVMKSRLPMGDHAEISNSSRPSLQIPISPVPSLCRRLVTARTRSGSPPAIVPAPGASAPRFIARRTALMRGIRAKRARSHATSRSWKERLPPAVKAISAGARWLATSERPCSRVADGTAIRRGQLEPRGPRERRRPSLRQAAPHRALLPDAERQLGTS